MSVVQARKSLRDVTKALKGATYVTPQMLWDMALTVGLVIDAVEAAEQEKKND